MATKVGAITLDGSFTDWPAADMIMTSKNTVSGYQVYGAGLADATLGAAYVIGIAATNSSDPVIAASTTIDLNTDQNALTGYSPSFAPGKIGAEYEVVFSNGSNGQVQPFLYSVTSTGALTALNNGAALGCGFSSNGESVEVAIPQSLLTPSGGSAPTSIAFAALINNATGLPGDFNNSPEYTIAAPPAPAAPPSLGAKKVGIVYSATTAALYFGGGMAGKTAYSDLFMTAQQQADAAGVSYDLLTEADLTNVAKLSQYSALIFPGFQFVQLGQLSAIQSALGQVVTQYHVPIITAGAFMTNDQTGAALSGNPYASMQTLLNVTPGSSETATYSVIPDATALAGKNPVLSGYASGQLIGGDSGMFPGTTKGYYTNEGYTTFAGYSAAATTIADIKTSGGATLPGVVQSTTGATVFGTTGLFGDSNLLQHVIRNAVFGATPSVAMDITRFNGLLNSRTDMDQSQYTSDVSPASGQGIYAKMIPILQSLKQQYDFVGSYYINIGDKPSAGQSTNWAVSLPYYQQLLRMGNEIGTHSYTHLVNPPSGVPSEDTNYLGTGTGAFTYAYEFGTSKTVESTNIGITIAGAAVPGANDTLPDSQQILSYFPSTSSVTGYVSGGWTGVGSGSPNAIGYITPSDTGAVYIAPNVTFDFTEIQYQNKTPAVALADWESLFDQLSANSATPIIVWPWHDYGITNFSNSGYTQAMFSGFVQYAYNAGYEFVTSETLAQRVAAEQAATLSESTGVNASGATVITASVTPSASKADLGGMALNLVNGAAGQVIANAGGWYAYDTNSVFLANDTANKAAPETFTVTLGATQDDLTHVDSLPMRAELQSATGDGTNLTFAFTGDGVVDIHLKTPGENTNVVSVQSSIAGTVGAGAVAPTATLVGNDLQLTFNDGAESISSASPQGVPVLHTVTITEGATAVAGSAFVFAVPTVAITSAGGLTNQKTLTISGTVTEPTASQVVGTTVSLTDNGSTTPLGTATVKAGVAGGLPTWTATVTLTGDGTHSIVASDTDVSRLTGSSAAIVYTLDTVPPTVAITTAGGATSQATQTIAGTVTATGAAAGSTVTLYDNGTQIGTATVSNGTWSTTVTLNAGSNSIVASNTDAAGNTGKSGAVAFTLGAQGPTVAITSAGGAVTSASQTITGTVSESAISNVVGSTVSLYDNGATTPFATTMVQDAVAGGIPTWSAAVTLSPGAHSIVARDVDLAGATGASSAVVYTYSDPTAAPTITSESYSGSKTKGHWVLGGTAAAGAGVTVYDGATALGTTTATTSGTWTFTTRETNGAIRTYTAVSTSAGATSAASAPVVEGTTGNDVFSFASEATVSAAALINGAGGTDTLQLTAAGQLTDADFAHIQAIQVLGLTGASGVTLGANASRAGVATVVTGNGATSVTDTNAGTLTVNAAAMASATLTLAGSTAMAVTSLQGALDATGETGTITVTATGTAAQSITAGSGRLSIADSAKGGVTVDAAALGASSPLTLSGSAARTVNNLTGTVTASGAGALTVTTGAGSATVTTGAGVNTINAGAMTAGQTLTLKGSSAATVTAGGDLNASGDTGALAITATGGGTTIQTGGGKDTVIAKAGGNTITVNGKGDNINVTGHTAADSFVYSATSASPNTSSGRNTITGFAAGGTINDLLNVSAINPNLAIQGALSAGTKVAADSISWLYSGGAMVYVNNTTSALSTSSTNLMAISLAGVSSGLSASNFRA